MVKSDLILVDEIAFNLKTAGFDVSTISVDLAKRILADAREKHVSSGRRPSTLAVSALYIACRMEGNRIRQMDFASVAGVTEVTIMTFHKFLMGRLGLVFPSDEPRKRWGKVNDLKVRLERVLVMIDDCSERLKKLESERDSLLKEVEILLDLAKEEAV